MLLLTLALILYPHSWKAVLIHLMWSQSFTSSAACRSFWIKTLSSVPPLSVLQGEAPYRFVYSYFELIAVLIP